MTEVPRRPWSEFEAGLDWQQGEHMTMVGPTGSGKTHLALALLPRRQYVCAIGTKPKDKTLDRLVKRDGWKRYPTWSKVPAIGFRKTQRIVLWPKFTRAEHQPQQAAEISYAVHEMFAAGGWTIFADELWYLENIAGLKRLMQMLWTQGRSIGVTVVGGTQRPAHVSLLAYDQATHLFFWRDNDEANLKRIGGLGGLNARLIRATVASLDGDNHEVLYVNTRTGDMAVTVAERK